MTNKPIQVIHIMEDGVGLLDWELPKEFGDKLSELDEDSQQAVRDVITEQMRAHLHLLMGALNMREKAMDALDEITRVGIAVGKRLLAQI